ncbi:bromodomain-containing protein 1 [Anopheles maculipalpis]|uniref:bromodomain-containing protein 1 n=1 Tax=Anopheles maculipalpis TaxID=1496333 RepID=UPI002158CD04|nr:bromodomain-containing protein 1 [Anopheles maculipalpis]
MPANRYENQSGAGTLLLSKRAMGIDFDVIDYIKTLKKDNGPYKCPLCDKTYKSGIGLQYHLTTYDHENPSPAVPASVATPIKQKGRKLKVGVTPKNQIASSPPKEGITYLESEHLVRLDCNGKTVKIPVLDALPVMSLEEYESKCKTASDFEAFAVTPPEEPEVQLPEGKFKEIEDYTICDAPARPNAYIRFIEKSSEELDGEVEYDVDEEDTTWLSIINERRAAQNVGPVPVDSLELLMDRLEKESFFQAAANGQNGAVVDDDAVCCICMDGECQNTNVILFCDMCNLAVHQDCYGVPYIPEGQWLCRRCLQSPSRPVDCVLCPNTGGAFKQTDHGQWAHVVCALWIPEVRFANTVFLEPIDSIETIPAARWRLTCYICKQKGNGACIQCNKTYCYAAFHVTCAQQAGLCMRMDTVKGTDSNPVVVQKMAYCDAHTPLNALQTTPGNSPEGGPPTDAREVTREKMKKARKLLALKRTSAPVILIPTIPQNRIEEISSLVNIPKKQQFIQRLIAYWTLKRQYRNGVPLLRRLQSQGQAQGTGIPGCRDRTDGSPDAQELYQQLKYWQCLRQDLERSRLLCELVRKREKIKLILIKTTEQLVMATLNPIESVLHRILDQLEAKDDKEIFREPVDTEEVPDYMDIVKHPMDLGTMRQKLKRGMYVRIEDLEQDFALMIRNCLAYNNKDTMFYRAGVRMRDAGAIVFRTVRKELERAGHFQQPPPVVASLPSSASTPVASAAAPSSSSSARAIGSNEDNIAMDIENELTKITGQSANADHIGKLQTLLSKANGIRHALTRSKRIKQIRNEIARVKRAISKDPERALLNDRSMSSELMGTGASLSSLGGAGGSLSLAGSLHSPKKHLTHGHPEPSTSGLVGSSLSAIQKHHQITPEASPHKVLNNSPSPSGVNRRTAVLFTRKAQAALKKPETPLKPDGTGVGTGAGSSGAGGGGGAGGTGGGPSASATVTPMTTTELLQKTAKKINRGKRIGKSGKSIESFLEATSASALDGKPIERKSLETIPDSFRVYRGQQDREISDSESNLSLTGSTCSSCSGFSGSGTESEFGSSNDDSYCDSEMSSNSEQDVESFPEKPALEPLKLVWAKCRGYPWYPALIIDPNIPKGFVHNGVPLPAPPADVLALRSNYDEPVFLVLFFDVKRTWQWLPVGKLELLGVDKELDQSKLIESRKPTERKAVNKAYQEALHYHSQVSSADGPAGKL